MSRHSDTPPGPEDLRKKIMGLGDRAGRKSYYPQLQARIRELEENKTHLERQSAAMSEMLAHLEEARRRAEESERKYRVVVENTSDVIWVLDVGTGRFRYVSPSVEGLRGFTAEEVLEQRVEETLAPPFRENAAAIIEERLAEFLREVKQVHVDEVEQCRRDGTTVWTEVTTHFVRNEETGRIEIYGMSRDITERRERDQALRESLAEKVVLLKEVHHRVKNNLQIVASLLSLQARRSGNPQTAEVLRELRNRVRSMAMLHEALYRSGNLARIDFAAYVENLGRQLLASFGLARSGVGIVNRVSPIELPLEQAVPCGLIINELVANALKHAFPDGRGGTVTVELCLSADNEVTLDVLDDGVGLPSGRVSAEPSALGLRLVANLAEQLGGTFNVEEPRKAGSRFRITFPITPTARIRQKM